MALSNVHLLSYGSGGQKSKIKFTGSRCWQGRSLLEALRTNPVSLPLQTSCRQPHSLACHPLPPTLKVISPILFLLSSPPLTLTLLPPSQKGPCGYTRLTQTIQHNQLSQNPSSNHTSKVPFVIYGYCRRFCKLGYAHIWGPIIQPPINCYLCS